MSYTLNPQIKKSRSISKYLYSSIDESDDFYIFDIKLISDKKKFKKFKKIKNSKSGMLLNTGENVNSSKYSKLLIEIATTNNINDVHYIDISLKNSDNKSIIYKDDFIYLEITSEYNLLKCFYNLEIID